MASSPIVLTPCRHSRDYVQLGNGKALSEQIRILREDAEIRDRFIGNGKEKVARLFDIEQTVNETEKVFYGLVAH